MVSRSIHVLSVFLVFSYIFFDVLDIDGSNFPSLFTPVERAITVAVVPSAGTCSPEQIGTLPRYLGPGMIGGIQSAALGELSKTSPLSTARSHGYRVGLAAFPSGLLAILACVFFPLELEMFRGVRG
jgi:hypothetical protein